MKTKFLIAIRNYIIPVFLFFYVILHLILTQSGDLSPWKMGGYGMYSTYHPNRNVIWLETDSKRMLAESLSELNGNSQFNKQLKICRTKPSDQNLIRLQSTIKESTGTAYRIEIWRPDFDTETQNLSFKLINSIENTIAK